MKLSTIKGLANRKPRNDRHGAPFRRCTSQRQKVTRTYRSYYSQEHRGTGGLGTQKLHFSKIEHRLRDFDDLKRIVSFELTEKGVSSNQILVELQLCKVCCFRHHKCLLDDGNLMWPCLLKKLGDPKALNQKSCGKIDFTFRRPASLRMQMWEWITWVPRNTKAFGSPIAFSFVVPNTPVGKSCEHDLI